MRSISETITLYGSEFTELQQRINEYQEELKQKIQSTPVPISNIL